MWLNSPDLDAFSLFHQLPDTTGAFRSYLEQHPPTKKTCLLGVSVQVCRAGLFDAKDKISLEKMGLQDLVTEQVLSFGRDTAMSRYSWASLSATELLRQLYIYHLAVEPHPGAARAVYDGCAKDLIAAIERPLADPDNGAPEVEQRINQIGEILNVAARRYADMEAAWDGPNSFLRVYVAGQTMTRGNDLPSIRLFKQMSEQGLRLVIDPLTDLHEYFARVHPRLFYAGEGYEAVTHMFVNELAPIRSRYYREVRKLHPWLPQPDVPATIAKAAELIDPKTFGTCIMEIGPAVRAWDMGIYDGVVMAACWGCDNSLVTEQLLRGRKDIPLFVVYDDGTPLDERRVRSYCHRLRRNANNGAARTTPSNAPPLLAELGPPFLAGPKLQR